MEDYLQLEYDKNEREIFKLSDDSTLTIIEPQ
jgi:hypothetical protein